MREVVGNEGGGGVRGSLGGLQRRAGKQEVAGALRARATPRLCLLAEEEEDKGGGGGLGRPDGAGPGKWRQVSGPGGLLSFIFVLFSIFCSLF